MAHHVEDVVVSIVRAQVIQRHQPAALPPEGRFIRADGNDIKGVASGRNIYRQTLAQDVLTQHHPVQLDPALLFEFRGELLHQDHVGVVHGGDGQLRTPVGRIENPRQQRGAQPTVRVLSGFGS